MAAWPDALRRVMLATVPASISWAVMDCRLHYMHAVQRQIEHYGWERGTWPNPLVTAFQLISSSNSPCPAAIGLGLFEPDTPVGSKATDTRGVSTDISQL